jgi:two-component system response regulator YesN
MYRVLVADDEIPIIRWFKTSVDWRSHNLCLVASVTDGLAALNTIQTLLPDIVVIDIRMPGLGGLDVIDRASRIKPDIQFVILSGYSSFQYAQRAVGLKVVRYLVKPLDEDDLMDVLDSIVADLRRRGREQRHAIALESNLQTLIPIARRQLVREWLMDPNDLQKTWPRLLRLTQSRDLPIRLLVLYARDGMTSVVLRALTLHAESIFHHDEVIAKCMIQDVYVIIVQSLPYRDLVLKLRDLRQAIVNETGQSVRFIVSGMGRFYNAPDLFRDVIREIKPANSLGNPNPTTLGSNTDSAPASHCDDDGVAVQEIIQELWREKVRPETHSRNKLVNRMLAAIPAKLTNPSLSLKWLAKNVVFGNPDYLSKVFVRETGLRFTDLVTAFRIETAKVLLRMGSPDTIGGVAQAVGYAENCHYFSHVFHRVTGVSPTDFRNEEARRQQSHDASVQ